MRLLMYANDEAGGHQENTAGENVSYTTPLIMALRIIVSVPGRTYCSSVPSRPLKWTLSGPRKIGIRISKDCGMIAEIPRTANGLLSC